MTILHVLLVANTVAPNEQFIEQAFTEYPSHVAAPIFIVIGV